MNSTLPARLPRSGWVKSRSMPRARDQNEQRLKSKRIGFVSQKRRRFSPLLLWRPSKAHAWAATVFLDKLDTAFFQSRAYLLYGSLSSSKLAVDGL
jgi:hypothetical protein